MKRLLITGAAGNLGKLARARLGHLADTLRLSDIADMDPAGPGEEVVACDLGDEAAVFDLVKDCDGILHLGGVSVERPWDMIQRGNITGLYNLYEAARAHAGLLAVWMRRTLTQSENQPAPRIPAAERLTASFCGLVEKQYRSGKPMADYAEALGVTPTHLSRACRQVAGLTAADIITQRVLYAARDMLERGDLPIRLIAEMLGFSSAAYFTRFIQNQTHQTPSALRQAVRG